MFTESLQWFWLPSGLLTNQGPAKSLCVDQSQQRKTCTAELSFLFTFWEPAIHQMIWDILLFQQSQQNSHFLWHRKEVQICLHIFPDSDGLRFFPPAAVALHWPRLWSNEQLIQNLPTCLLLTPSSAPVILRWKWKRELGGRSPIVHCCTLSLCYLGAEMINTGIQMPITEII